MILSRHPSEALSDTIECIWHHETRDKRQHAVEAVLPDGRFQVVFNLSAGAAVVSGLRSNRVVVDPARVSHVMGVVFRAGGQRSFFEQPAREFYERSVSLELVWGQQANRLLDRLQSESSASRRLALLESALVAIRRNSEGRRPDVHQGVDYALRTIQKSPHIKTVADISRETGWSRRWFSQAFGDLVGVTPKRYCRLVRFQRVVGQIAANCEVNWAELALATGFADQSHLAHEFRAFSGLSLERFVTAERPSRNHVRLGAKS